MVTGFGIGGLHVGLLAPDTSTPRKYIDRPTTAGTVVSLIAIHSGCVAGFKRRPDDQRVPIKCDVRAEVVTGLGIRCLQVGLLTPDSRTPREYIDRPTTVGTVISLITIDSGCVAGFQGRPDDQRVPLKSDTGAEVITGLNIGSLQVGLLTPDSRTLREHIDCTTTAGSIVGWIANHVAVFKRSPGNQCVPIEGYRSTKQVTRTRI